MEAQVARASLCVVLAVRAADDAPLATLAEAAGWDAGPLPVGRVGSHHADARGRLTYFEPRVAASLFGTRERPTRWHRAVVGATGRALPDHVSAVTGAELLSEPVLPGAGPVTRGLAVLHLTPDGHPHAAAVALSGTSGLRAHLDRYADLLPAGVRPDPDRRPWLLTHTTFTEPRPPVLLDGTYAHWQPHEQWLWLTASGTRPRDFPPDPDDPDLFAGRVRFSADWQALVLRDGAAFVGTSPDPGDDSTFHATAEALVHSLYLDVFLLGRLQTDSVNSMANTLSALRADEAHAARLQRLEGRLIDLRRALWSSHITRHGKANELLERFQEQQGLPHLLASASTTLTDAARYVEAGRARRSGIAVGLLSAVGLPFGLVYGAGALWGGGARVLLVCTGIALAVTGLLFALLPPLRGLLSEEIWKRED